MDDIVAKEKLNHTFVYLDNVTVAGRTKEELDKNVTKFLEVANKLCLTLNHSKTVSTV